MIKLIALAVCLYNLFLMLGVILSAIHDLDNKVDLLDKLMILATIFLSVCMIVK